MAGVSIDPTFGLGLTGIMIVLLVALLLSLFLAGWQFKKKPFYYWNILIVFFLLLGFLSYAGVFALTTPPAEIEEQPVFELSLTESMTHVTYDSTTHHLTMACDYNDTSDAFANNTQYLQVNVTISRADVLLTNAIAQASFGSVGVVDVAGGADEYIVDQNADDTYKALWTKAGGITAWEHTSVLVEAGESAWIVLNVTLNADAMAHMDKFDTVTYEFTIADITFEVTVMKANCWVG
ncbi:MAG: hypothetical protein PHG80_10955 [Methanoregulaceae archaeon]|nr:hypothetical protein [Methanoregulaceae archaeon]